MDELERMSWRPRLDYVFQSRAPNQVLACEKTSGVMRAIDGENIGDGTKEIFATDLLGHISNVRAHVGPY